MLNRATELPEGTNCPEGASTRGQAVLNHEARCAGRYGTFNSAAHPVLLFLFPNRERVECATFHPTSVRDGVGYGVGPEGETTDMGWHRGEALGDTVAHPPDRLLTRRRHGGPSGIDVVVRTDTAH